MHIFSRSASPAGLYNHQLEVRSAIDRKRRELEGYLADNRMADRLRPLAGRLHVVFRPHPREIAALLRYLGDDFLGTAVLTSTSGFRPKSRD